MALTAERLREALARLPPEAASLDAGGGNGRPGPGTHPPLASSRSHSVANVEAPDVTWTEQWPFPRFLPKSHEEAGLDAESDDSDTPAAPPRVVEPHPLSTDAVLEEARRLGEQSRLASSRRKGAGPTPHKNTPMGALSSSLGHPPRSAGSAMKAVRRPSSAFAMSRASPTGPDASFPASRRASSSFGGGPRLDASSDVQGSPQRGDSPPNGDRSPKSTVTKEEITALISIFDSTNPLGSRVDMSHMDLSWVVRKRRAKGVTPPAVHLHLGNLAASLEGVIKDRQVLINSPRSALVLLRNGVTIPDLKKQAANLSCAVVEERPFVTLEQLTWEQKKYLAIETARVAKLREIAAEYKAVCEHVTFDDVVNFCDAYHPEQPSSAMLVPFVSDRQDAGGHRHRRAPAEQCAERLNKLVERFQRRADRLNRSAELLSDTQEVDRERTVERLLRADQRAEHAKELRLEHVRSLGVASRGKSELWRAQRSRHDRVENFRRMVTREGLQRRLDEVASVQTGMEQTIRQFQDTVRRRNLSEAMTRENTSTAAMRRAKARFRETKK